MGVLKGPSDSWVGVTGVEVHSIPDLIRVIAEAGQECWGTRRVLREFTAVWVGMLPKSIPLLFFSFSREATRSMGKNYYNL